MEPDQNNNCLLCEIMLPEYEETIRRQIRQIQHLKLIIEQQRDRLSSHNSPAAESPDR